MRLALPFLPTVRILAALWMATCACAQVQPDPHGVEKSVVKVFSTLRQPDPMKPWTKQEPAEVTGSGLVIEFANQECETLVFPRGELLDCRGSRLRASGLHEAC